MEWMSILRLMLQTPIVDDHKFIDKALDREMMSLPLEEFMVAPTPRKLEGKLEALQISATLETRYLIEKMAPNSWQFSARNDDIVIRGVHDVATDTSAETRKLEGRLDALVNLVPQLAANQKHASVARVCGIRSSNVHHTSVCPSSQQSGVDENPEAYTANTYSRPLEQQGQGT
ncbi:hypothetical protein Fmac_028632 [Flemingia macrophylla]|uniref:Uncharacterized protein n=1 Tax=Flemingia macrophylla TaxID=520843 RepID=A0ABD1L821_9FABA